MSGSNLSKLKYAFFIACLATLLSCKETNPGPQPGITTISPQAGVASMEVTIEGSNFDPNRNGNKVSFNGVEAHVSTASSNKLVVIVPDGAKSGPISIKTFFGTANSKPFRAYEVYVIVNELVPGGQQLSVWHSGKSTIIETSPLFPTGTRLAVNGTDFHVVGYRYDGNYNPVYWKNSVSTQLGTGGEATDIRLVGNSIHISGTRDNGGFAEATYWNALSPQDLMGSLNGDESASSISISVNDIYIGGSQIDANGVAQATYWKNGLPVTLGSGNTENWLVDMEVVPGAIHAVSQENYDPGVKAGITYWKNDLPTVLEDDSGYAGALSLAASGNNVMIGGFKEISGYYVATIWVNGTAFPLANPGVNSLVSDVAIYENDLFVAGFFSQSTTGLGFLLVNEGVVYLNSGTRRTIVTGMVVRPL